MHDQAAQALWETHSLNALVYLIDHGRELEFTADGEAYFLSRSRAAEYVSLWHGGTEQSFDSMQALLEYAVINGRPFLSAWTEVHLQTLF